MAPSICKIAQSCPIAVRSALPDNHPPLRPKMPIKRDIETLEKFSVHDPSRECGIVPERPNPDIQLANPTFRKRPLVQRDILNPVLPPPQSRYEAIGKQTYERKL